MTASAGDIWHQYPSEVHNRHTSFGTSIKFSANTETAFGLTPSLSGPKIMMVLLCVLVLNLIFVESFAEQQFEDYEVDPKDAFFRHLRSYDVGKDLSKHDFFRNIPKPGGFRISDEDSFYDREKRSYHVLPSPGLTSHFKITTLDEKPKYKRTKRHATTSEEKSTSCEEEQNVSSEPSTSNVIINDFIRFKRSSEDEDKIESDPQASRPKREPEIRTEKMVMERGYGEPGAEREPRGATKEQWIKQPYPVERPEEDNVPSASDTIRAPRVHFVTQRRPGQPQTQGPEARQPQGPAPPQPPPPVFHSHRPHEDREGRARDFDPYHHPPLPPQTYYPYPRPRSYEPYRPRYYDPYYERFDGRRYGYDGYDPRFKYEEQDGRPMMLPPQQAPLPPVVPNKQRRIIYYATLPEVVRSPQNGDQRYRYRDGYEDRYMGAVTAGAPAAAPATDPYRVRKSYGNQMQKQRDYERAAADRKKTPLYPVKVSTDVNVREPKKNPERRIYSETDRRFNYKTPSFQTAEDTNF